MSAGSPDLDAAWRAFIDGRDNAEGVRPLIFDSWARCKRNGVNPGTKEAPIQIEAEAGLAEVRKHSQLFKAAHKVLPVLGHCLTGAPCFIGLYDDQGLTLDALGFEQAKKAAESAKAVPGSRWIEQEVGTDAVPTCLVLGVPVEVGASEHYVENWHNWWGAAAPVRDPFTNKLVGALGLYGYAKVPHLRSLALVTDFAAAIERELRASLLEAQVKLFRRYEEYIRGVPNSGVLAIAANGHILTGTPSGRQLLGISPERLKRGITLQELLTNDRAFDPESITYPKEVLVDAISGDPIKMEAVPVFDEGRPIGVLAVLPQTKGSSERRTGAGWIARYNFSSIAGQHEALRACVAHAERIAALDLPVLIRGETGTGKELFAHSIHNASTRALGPFVSVNCGAVTEELLTAELFGYCEGAFTGAVRGGKPGKFQLADRGTLFLDEIESASVRVQTHLLRVLEDKIVIPVGSEKPKSVDVRVVAATNVDLTEQVRAGTFRQDLYYRLNCASLPLPALRDRLSDIPLLAKIFLGSSGPELTSEAARRLESYCWPGNVRELKNVIEQSMIQCEGSVILESDLPGALCPLSCRASTCPFGAPSVALPTESGSVLDRAERDAIIGLLGRFNGNLSQIAHFLKIDRSTLYRKLKRHNIQTLTKWH